MLCLVIGHCVFIVVIQTKFFTTAFDNFGALIVVLHWNFAVLKDTHFQIPTYRIRDEVVIVRFTNQLNS